LAYTPSSLFGFRWRGFFYSPPYIKAYTEAYAQKQKSTWRWRGLSALTSPPLYKAMLNAQLLLSATYPPLYKETTLTKQFQAKTLTTMQVKRVLIFCCG
jgi:hypothetical protein